MTSFSVLNKKAELSAVEKVVARQELVQQMTGVSSERLASLFVVPEGVDGVSTKNCENLVGQIAVPVGVAGPLALQLQRVVGSDHEALKTEIITSDTVLVPLATTEGALVASVNRGCKALTQSGGAQVMTEYLGITRAPVFLTKSGWQARQLINWFSKNHQLVADWAAQTSTHLRLVETQGWVRGRYAFVRFVADTDQAMGMNMISIAIQRVWAELEQHIKQGRESELAGIKMISLSSNVCSDKKAGVINGLLGRGHWVQAEATLPNEVIEQVLKTNSHDLVQTHRAKNEVGSALAGSLAQNMQVANVAVALFAATGQDLAHVVDASQAITQVEAVEDGVSVAVTLPSVPVGVVGGGTWLPAQQQARQLLGFGDQLSAWQLAGVVGAAALAGEVSGLAALSSNQLACAHQALGRSK